MKYSTLELDFPAVRGKTIVGRFDGGEVTSDAGVMLLWEADRKMGLSATMAGAATDRRQQEKVTHPIEEMIRQRVYAICLGYEDANDLDVLAKDPALKSACGRLPSGKDLASQPTISRLENGVTRKGLLEMGMGIAERVVASLPRRTKRVIVEVDVSDDPCHGQQELQFFSGYYDEHCYLPLYLHITGGDGRRRLTAALLRHGKAYATVGLFGVLTRVVGLLRERFPKLKVILRADGSFGVEEVIGWCEGNGVDFVLGLSTNKKLAELSTPTQMDAALKYGWEGDGCREYGEFGYQAKTWAKERRVIVKAEITGGALAPRYVVTNLGRSPRRLYEFYCRRGDQENGIKEMKLDLASGRTSCHRFLANQFRLLLHTAACVLMGTLQEALEGTQWAKAQVGTIRYRLLKVGARVVETCRKIWLHLPTSFTEKEAWLHAHRRLLSGTA
jgi:hypothetical protein